MGGGVVTPNGADVVEHRAEHFVVPQTQTPTSGGLVGVRKASMTRLDVTRSVSFHAGRHWDRCNPGTGPASYDRSTSWGPVYAHACSMACARASTFGSLLA